MTDQAEPASWTAHTSSSGRTFYYDRLSGTSTWTRPPNFAAPSAIDTPAALRDCLAHPVVARLVGQILTHCGVDALPTVGLSTKQTKSAHKLLGRWCCLPRSSRQRLHHAQR